MDKRVRWNTGLNTGYQHEWQPVNGFYYIANKIISNTALQRQFMSFLQLSPITVLVNYATLIMAENSFFDTLILFHVKNFTNFRLHKIV